jgi:hypothetical protein
VPERVIIEDCDDAGWLHEQRDMAIRAIDDPRVIRADEVYGWKVRLGRIDDRLEYLERRK